jgi:hypothetical protein
MTYKFIGKSRVIADNGKEYFSMQVIPIVRNRKKLELKER